MKHQALPIFARNALSAAMFGALLGASHAAQAACTEAVPVATTPATPVTDTPVTDTPTFLSGGLSASAAPGRATALAFAVEPPDLTGVETGTTDTSGTAATPSTTPAAAASIACTQDAWSAPVAAQGLHHMRHSLRQTLNRLSQLRSEGSTRAQSTTRLYALGSDQSRREGGNTDTGASALRVSRADFTMGADHRFNDQWVVGGSVGAGGPRMRWAGNTTRIDGSSTQLTTYASWSPSSASYVAAGLSAEGTRYSLQTDDGAGSTRIARATGINTGLSVSAGYDFTVGGFTLSPYSRLDRVASRISSFEAGSSASKGRSVAFSAGGQVQTSVPTNWGLIAPHARLEFTRVNSWHLDGDSAATYAASAGVLPSPNPTVIDRSFGQFGVGASALMQNGLTLFSDYDQGFAQKGVSSWRFTMGLRTEL
jgi:outer membrane autotransporter protein